MSSEQRSQQHAPLACWFFVTQKHVGILTVNTRFWTLRANNRKGCSDKIAIQPADTKETWRFLLLYIRDNRLTPHIEVSAQGNDILLTGTGTLFAVEQLHNSQCERNN